MQAFGLKQLTQSEWNKKKQIISSSSIDKILKVN